MAELIDKDTEELSKKEQSILKQIQVLIHSLYMSVFEMSDVKQAILKRETFWFKRYPSAEKAINQKIAKVTKQFGGLVLSGVEQSWNQGEKSTWDQLKAHFSKSAKQAKAFDEIRQQATASHRGQGARNFINDKKNGFDLSKRVWRATQNAKAEMETVIQNGILEGKSAAEMSQGVREYLREPDKLFRRVRNKESGKLELSEAAKKYHPGRGVYRSSYKNAMRLTRTEINRAYRDAEWQNYQQNPLITGYRIELSNNHTLNGKPFKDICDTLAGTYPKSFKWAGWHPQCRCRMIPVLITPNDFEARLRARAAGTLDKWEPDKTVTDMPVKFRNWASREQDRIDGRASTPYFVRDNFNKGKIKSGLKLETKQAAPVTPMQDLMTRAKQAGPELTSVTDNLVKRFGGYASPLNYKSEESILRKANSDLGGDVTRVKDAIRNTIVLDKAKIESVVAALKQDSRFSVKVQSPDKDPLGYSGVIATFKTGTGLTAEIQLNTEKMIFAKELPENAIPIIGAKSWDRIRKEVGLPGGLGHKYYEECRKLDESKDLLRIRELSRISKAYYSNFY